MTNDELLERIEENQVVEKLVKLKNELQKQGIVTDGPDLSRPQDPCLRKRDLSSKFVMQILIPPKAGNSITINLRPACGNPHSPRKEERHAFDAFMVWKGYQTSNDGAFCQLERKIPLDEVDRVLAQVSVARQIAVLKSLKGGTNE